MLLVATKHTCIVMQFSQCFFLVFTEFVDLINIPNIKFNRNLSVVSCTDAWEGWQIDIAKLIGTFCGCECALRCWSFVNVWCFPSGISHVLPGLASQQNRMQFQPQPQQQPQQQQQHLVVGPPGPSPNSTSNTPQGPPGSMVTVSGPGLSPYGQPISQVSNDMIYMFFYFIQCHHMSIMDLVISLLVVADV
jgi:hypothetical protein